MTSNTHYGRVRVTGLALLMLALPGCSPERSEVSEYLTTPSLVVDSGKSWTGAKPDEPVLATVNGIPVPKSRLQRALADSGKDADPREVLKGILTQEILAQAAIRKQPGYGAISKNTFKQALVARMIEDRFVDRFQPADIPEEDLDKVFRIPAVSGRYNHLDIYSVQDYQWICCDASPDSCQSAESMECFARGKAAVEVVLQKLAELMPDSEDIPLILDDLRRSAPSLTYQEYDFFFDPDSGRQKGRRIFDDDVVAAVVSVSPGRFAGKVRSAFGWHIPFLKSRLPAVHKDLSDPEVKREVSEFFHPKFQQRRFMDAMAELLPVMEFQFLAPMFRHREPKKQPAYAVELFPDDLAGLDQSNDEIEGL